MSQATKSIANVARSAFRAAVNAALQALETKNAAATEPPETWPYQEWADETSGWLKQRNAANDGWVNIRKLADAITTTGEALRVAANAAAARSALAVLSSAENQTQAAIRFTAGGTGDAITGTLSPVIGSYTAGLRVTTTPSANTVTGPTLNLNSLGVKTVKKRDSSGSKVALVAGDYNASGPFDFEYDGTDFVLLNPIVSTSGSTDQVARDQIALTNMRLMLNSAVTTGALVQGKQWELETDEWAASSTNETYTSATPNYYGASGEYTADQIPTMTSNTAPSGVASQSSVQGSAAWNAYDDNTAAQGMYTNAFPAWSKYQFASSVAITRYSIVPEGAYRWPTHWQFQGSTNNTDWTTLHTVSGESTGGWTARRYYEFSNSTAYTYYRLYITAGTDATYCMVNEIEMMASNLPLDMTLIPSAAVSVSAAPTFMDAYFLWKDDSGSAVLGTDLTVELSRDNGTTYTVATLTNLASYDGTYSIVKARADVSAQPSGTSMLCRIKTLNNKAQRVAAPALYAE